MKVLTANPNTIAAIQKAAHIARNLIPSGKNMPGSAQMPVDSDYSGPFAVSQKDDTTVTVAIGDCYFGMILYTFAEADVATTGSGVIYLEAVWGGAAWTVTAKFAAAMPAPALDKSHGKVAEITFENDAISEIKQCLWGDWRPNGRIL